MPVIIINESDERAQWLRQDSRQQCMHAVAVYVWKLKLLFWVADACQPEHNNFDRKKWLFEEPAPPLHTY